MDTENHNNHTHCQCFANNNKFALVPRVKAPKFEGTAVLANNKFKKVSLDDYKGKYVVLIFYPYDFSYVCPTELIAFSDQIQEFRKLNTEIIGVSCDSKHTHLAFKKTPRNQGGIADLEIPLIADFGKTISKAYGVLIDDERDEMYGTCLRAVVIISGTQIIRSATINDDAIGRSVEETLRTIEAVQYADEFGEVCPANWKKGQDTIIPDQEKKHEFFSKKQ